MGVQKLPFNPRGHWMSEKIDGYRATWNGVDFLSANGNAFAVPAFFKAGLPDKLLVGELFIGCAGGFEQLQSTVASGIGWERVRFAIFDTGVFPPQIEVVEQTPFAFVIPQVSCRSLEHCEQFYNDILATGGEGVMLRIGSVFTKIKPRDDAEAVVIGYNASAQDHGIGSLTVRNERGTFRVAGLGFAVRFNPPQIGETITYHFTGYTRRGLPKHPKFARVRPLATIAA